MALVNASILIKNIHGSNNMTVKDFRTAIAVKYLKLGIEREALKGRSYSFPSTSKICVNENLRYYRMDHNIGRRNTQSCSQFKGFQSRTLTFFCKNCFKTSHKIVKTTLY